MDPVATTLAILAALLIGLAVGYLAGAWPSDAWRETATARADAHQARRHAEETIAIVRKSHIARINICAACDYCLTRTTRDLGDPTQ